MGCHNWEQCKKCILKLLTKSKESSNWTVVMQETLLGGLEETGRIWAVRVDYQKGTCSAEVEESVSHVLGSPRRPGAGRGDCDGWLWQ